MTVSVDVEQLEAVQEEWERILPACSTNTMFVTPLWQAIWWRHFGGDAEQRILSIRDNGTTAGIAPLMERDGTVGFLANDDVSDYADFLVQRGSEDVFYRSVLDRLATMDWHDLDLKGIPEASPTLQHMPPQAEAMGYTVEVLEEARAPVMALPGTWDEYVAGLSKKDRHELRRKMRRLEKAGVSHQYVCTEPDALQDCMKDFFRLHRESREDKAAYMTPERERFFTDVAVELAARGQFRLAFLEIDGVRVAACISFDYLDSYLLYNSGYDLAYSKLSVGLLNKALAVKEAIERGKRSFDFLRGTERYKYGLGGSDRSVYRLTVRR